jgi:hypothetical protein
MKRRSPRLEAIAREVVWWKPPEVTLSDPDYFLGKVMALGFWDDLKLVEETYGTGALRHALEHARPGVLDIASWHYWHHRLGIAPVPSLPQRRFL